MHEGKPLISIEKMAPGEFNPGTLRPIRVEVTMPSDNDYLATVDGSELDADGVKTASDLFIQDSLNNGRRT